MNCGIVVGLTLTSMTLLTYPLGPRKEEVREIGQTVRVQISKPEYWQICPGKHFNFSTLFFMEANNNVLPGVQQL